ncbi:MAG: universal stress protein [Dehalococcoidia bacterium]|nr:universal stress protein [Dehalococcoidia bacterium]
MFEKMLLPLDGSELAETAIPFAEMLAGKLGSEMVFLHVCVPEHEPYRHMHQIYLSHIADTVKNKIKSQWGKEATIHTESLMGKPADIIHDYVPKNGITMLVMTSCGASGIKALLGSVVDRVIRSVNVPTLLVRVKEGRAPQIKPAEVKKIILPLDGSEASNSAIPYAIELARKLSAAVILFQMAETVYAHGMDGLSAGVGVNWDQIDIATEKYVHAYLEKVEEQFKQKGISTSHVVKLGVDPANEILELERKTEDGLVAMATRGRSPVARWAFGSVAEKVLREGSLPLLVVKRG